MKIFYVGHSADGGYLYRCQNNINITKHEASGDINLRAEERIQTRKIIESDIVIFYRPADDKRLRLMEILKRKGVIVGYDNDDTFHFQESHRLLRTDFKKISKEKNEWNDKCLKTADFVTTTTEFLAKEYRKMRDNVYVLPNKIDFSLYPKVKKKRVGRLKRILLSGSLLWCNDAFNFIDVIKWLNEKKDYQVVMFGNYDDKMKMQGVEYHNYVSVLDYPQKLKELDIDLCLIPREDNYFNRCKSNCKYLEMSAMKIPVIAQGFPDKKSPYDITKSEGAPITIATDEKDWKDKITNFNYNKSGYGWVKKHYNNNSNTFDKIIEKII